MFDLPDPGRYHLASAPLRQAHAELRFPLVARFQSLEGVAPVQDRLSDMFPFMQGRDVTEMGVVIGPEGPSKPEVGSAKVWELSSEDGTMVTLGAGSATLSAGPEYGGVDWFLDRWSLVLDALVATGAIRRCDRIGVRYINVVEAAPGEPRSWVQWFRPEVVGWAAQSVFSDGTIVHTALNQMNLTVSASEAFPDFPGDVQGIIRNGLVQANSVVPGLPVIQLEHEALILDMDAFLVAPQPLSTDALTDQVKRLHHELDKFFRWSLTTDGAQAFELTEEVDS